MISLTEEMMLNPPKGFENWRRYRIEYGFECGCPEGSIYLPEHIVPEMVEILFEGIPSPCKCFNE